MIRYPLLTISATLLALSFAHGQPLHKEKAAARVDHEGNPLPAEAIGRVGSARFRTDTSLNDVAYSPDGKSIVALGYRSVQIWDAATGELRRELKLGERSLIQAMAYHADGSAIDLFSDGVFYSFDHRDGKQLDKRRIAESKGFGPACFNSDRTAIAWASWFGPTVHVVERATGKEMYRVDLAGKQVRSVALSADGALLAAGSLASTVELFNAATGKPLFELETPMKGVSHVRFSPNGKRLIAADPYSVTPVLWDLSNRKALPELPGFGKGKGGFTASAFSPDSKQVAIGTSAGQVVLYDATTAKEVRRFESRDPPSALAFSRDGKTILVGSSGELSQWDVEAGTLLPASADPLGGVAVVGFADRDKHLLAITKGGYVTLDWRTGREVERLLGAVAYVRDQDILSPDGKLRAKRVKNGISLHDARTGKEIQQVDESVRFAWPFCFSADSRKLFYVDSDKKNIHSWDCTAAKPEGEWRGHKDLIRKLAVSPDGRWLASASYDYHTQKHEEGLFIWEIATGRLVHRIGGRGRYVDQLVFAPDGYELAIVEIDPAVPGDRAELSFIDVVTGRTRRSIMFERIVTALAYSADGRSLAVASLQKEMLSLWETVTGQMRHHFEGHTFSIHNMTFCADGSLLAASSADAPAYLWDVYGKYDQNPPANEKWSAEELQRLRQGLCGSDAKIAFKTIRRLVRNPNPALGVLREHLKPAEPVDAKRVKQWLSDLASDDFDTRHTAQAELEKLGDRIEAPLKDALAMSPVLEAKRRVQGLLEKVDALTAERFTRLRALEALEQIGTPEAVEVLETLAAGERGARLTRDGAAALNRVRKR
jgi:WD40 repeat protein